jgi:hypothetical protein
MILNKFFLVKNSDWDDNPHGKANKNLNSQRSMLTIITLYNRDKQNSNIKDQEDAVENL